MALIQIDSPSKLPGSAKNYSFLNATLINFHDKWSSMLSPHSYRGFYPIRYNPTTQKLFFRRELIRRILNLHPQTLITNCHLFSVLSSVNGKPLTSEEKHNFRLGTGKISKLVGTGETVATESLQCVACAYYHELPSPSMADWHDYVGDLDEMIFQNYVSPNLEIPIQLKRVHYLYSHTNLPTKNQLNAQEWISSSYWIAEKLHKFLSPSKKYSFIHQNTKFGKTIKTDSISKLVKTFNLESISVMPDIYNPADMFAIESSQKVKIMQEFESNFVLAESSDILAAYHKNRHTYKSISYNHMNDRSMVQISLKKCLNPPAPLKIIGSAVTAGLNQFTKNIDEYTLFLKKLSETESETEVKKLIDSLVNILDIEYKNSTVTYYVFFDLRWNDKNIALSDEAEKLLMGTYSSTFNIKKRAGATAFYGGISFNGIMYAIKSYREFPKLIDEIVSIRKKAFGLFSDEAPPKDLLRSAILYKDSDLKTTKDALGDQYQDFLIECISRYTDLARKGASPIPYLLKKDTLEKFGKVQALWLFSRPGAQEWLNTYFKKQIVMTIYGIASKKGGKIFETTVDSSGVRFHFTNAFKEYIIPPHLILGQ